MNNTRGKYKTKQREEILSYLIENKNRHVTVDDIVDYIKELDLSIGKTTVYRYIDELEKQGKIRKYIIDKNVTACYQYIDDEEGCQQHFHLKCKVCGKLYHLDCEYLGDIKQHVFRTHGFDIDNSKTVFYGTCKECLKKIRGGYYEE